MQEAPKKQLHNDDGMTLLRLSIDHIERSMCYDSPAEMPSSAGLFFFSLSLFEPLIRVLLDKFGL